tara:strand:+ start:2228 stop:3733 length:1506 start_codon:yes stop_codon:yes gene_type:complete
MQAVRSSVAVQTAYWRRSRSGGAGGGTLVPTAPYVLELSTLCAAPEAFARSFLRERLRRPLSSSVDVPVVHDGQRLICHGPPSGWAPGTASRVQDGSLRLGVIRVRIQEAGAASERSERPPPAVSLSAPPVTSRRLAAGRLKVGVHSDRGGCSYMEDENVVHTTADYGFFCATARLKTGLARLPPLALPSLLSVAPHGRALTRAASCANHHAGIYDGHGGTRAAQFCREQLVHNVMASAAFQSGDSQAALLEGFAKTESDLVREQQQSLAEHKARCADGEGEGSPGRGGCCGSTALVVLLRADSLHLAWLGDCRAVLCRAGTAVALTTDHVLSASGDRDGSERARVLREGGHVEGGRLGGFLEVARAFGDVDHVTGHKPAGLSCTPELRAHRLTPDDEFVILGSDGLWNVVEPAVAVHLARAELQAYGDATMASEKLVEAALKRNADDNVTAMVVMLRPIESEASPRQRPRLSLLRKSASVPTSLSSTLDQAGPQAAGPAG